MTELHTLGSVGLQGPDGRAIEAVLRQPKRLALLVYLAAATPRGFHRRDTLLGLFWPELDESRARNSLGQMLHGLRRTLGSGIVVSRGSAEVGLSQQRLWCDVAGFREALEAGHRERALELYRGDLLDGFYLTDAAEFERWVEQERTRLRHAAANAATWLAEHGERAGDTKTATRWALRAADLSPYDESAMRRVITLLDRAGDRAHALSMYELFARRLEQELEVAPSPETQALIEDVRARKQPSSGTLQESHATPSLPVSVVRVEAVAPAPATDPRRVAESAEADPHTRSSYLHQRLWQQAKRHRVGAPLTFGVATVILALALVAWFPRTQPSVTAIDPGLVMIAPFRVAADGAVDYLSEGLVDLLATSLNGETGSRAVDPRSTIAAWRSAVARASNDLTTQNAQRVARGLGAGQLLTGSVIGGPAQLTIHATLYDVGLPAVRVRVSAQGPADSLPALVDGLVKQLLAREAGVPQHQLAALTTTSLPALRAYLEGVGDSRSGRYTEAVSRLEEALSYDSTFALAAIHLWLVAGRGQLSAPPRTHERALRLAHAARDRLSPPDRLLLDAIAGPRYPEPTPRHELFAARTRALNSTPDRPEALTLMGAFHLGGIPRGEANAHDRAIEYFGRALALDSSLAIAAHTLAAAAAAAGDTATVQRIVRRYLASDSTSETAHLLAWLQAVTGGEAATVIDLRARMPDMHPTALGWIVAHAMLLGLEMDGAEAALAALHMTARSDVEQRSYLGRNLEYLGNRGRLGEMQIELEVQAQEVENFGPVPELGMSAAQRARAQNAMHVISTGLFWTGDTTGIATAAALMEGPDRRSPALDRSPFARQVVAEGACFAGMARIAADDAAHARAALSRLQELLHGPLELPSRASHAACAATLAALIAVAERRPDARVLAVRADSVLRHDPPVRIVANRMQLLIARAFDALDDPEAALRVIRRRELLNPPFFLATLLREEGRLAARVGDREGAIRAYSHYLALRTDPDAALMLEVQQVRHELAQLRMSR